MAPDRRTRLLGVIGYSFAAAFVVVVAWAVAGQFFESAVAVRITVYFAVFVGVSFGFVYGFGANATSTSK